VSNSPPAKIQNALRRHEAARVLAQNFDTLYVAIDVVWVDERFLTLLGDLRAEGEAKESEQTSKITLADGSDTWRFNVLTHAMRGYAFIHESQVMLLRLTSSLTSISRPNVYAEFRSETLWRLTPELCIERIKRLLEEVGAEILSIKPSRVNLCVDVLVRERDFTPDLMPFLVTQAADLEPRYSRRRFSGYTVGKANIKARLYDKPLEIKHKSHKDWMYGIWGLDRVPPGHNAFLIARVSTCYCLCSNPRSCSSHDHSGLTTERATVN
jgi:hypothetical protein